MATTNEGIVTQQKAAENRLLAAKTSSASSPSIGKSTQKALLRSQVPALLEYGLVRLQFVCGAWNSAENLVAQREAITSQSKVLPDANATKLSGRGTTFCDCLEVNRVGFLADVSVG
jgi:hypothetical protein